MTEEMLDTRGKIVRAARELLTTGGREAVSTRAVSAAAGVQAPTIYRQFGDMRGLLDAVAADVLTSYVIQKSEVQVTGDAVADLRAGWLQHVSFGLANPAAYLLIYSDPETFSDTPAKREGEQLLVEKVARIAEAGRLKVSVPHAAKLVSAAGMGVVLSLIALPAAERDLELINSMCDAVMRAIVANSSPENAPENASADSHSRIAARAVALRAVLPDAPEVLSAGEHSLMSEWLDRLAKKRT